MERLRRETLGAAEEGNGFWPRPACDHALIGKYFCHLTEKPTDSNLYMQAIDSMSQNRLWFIGALQFADSNRWVGCGGRNVSNSLAVPFERQIMT